MSETVRRESDLLERSDYGTSWPPQTWIDPDTNERTIKAPLKESYVFGNPELPVAAFRDYIVDTISDNEVVVISSETGSGKSTFIPQALYESGKINGTIYITQPRIVATRTNTQYIRSQMVEAGGDAFASVIGYKTATEGDARRGEKILQCTDGLVLQKMIDEGAITKDDIVIIDEAHEKNVNITLVAGVAHKYRIPLVYMSATLNAEATARHAAKARGLENVPVVEIPGRMHEVEQREGGNFSDTIVRYAQENKNILAFVPGRREYDMTQSRIARRLPNGYTVLKLDGDQTLEEQQKCFLNYPDGVIVISTSVGQMSITVPNMDVVVDSGWERDGHHAENLDSLKVQPVSYATLTQRAGRVGRTKPGIYHQAQLEGYPPVPRDIDGNFIVNRYDVPAIQSTDLSSAALRLARAGLTLDMLDLEDKPKSSEVDNAHHKLVRFGAKTLESVHLTEIGERMANFPVDPNYARMLVEAQNHSIDVQLQAAAMLSVCQYDGITMTEKNMENWQSLSRENRSDMLVQLDVFIKSLGMTEAELNAMNIIQQRQIKALATYERLCKDLGLDSRDIKLPNNDERQALLACIITGSDKLFVSHNYGKYGDEAGFEGRFARSSQIATNPELVMGTPFRLEHMRNGSVKGHNLIKDATIVTPEMLEQYAPWRCSYNNERMEVGMDGTIVIARDLYFDGRPTKSTTIIPAERNSKTRDLLLGKLFDEHRRFENMSENAKSLYDEIDRIKTMLIDYSDNVIEYEARIGGFLKSIDSWDLPAANINELADLLAKKGVLDWLKNTVPNDSMQAKEIMEKAPHVIVLEVGDDIVEADVMYRNNEAFITINPNYVRYLEGVSEEQLHGRAVYVKAASQRFIPLEDAMNSYTGVNRATRRAAAQR